MGGLHIIGTERHESRRIDNQLRGRAGRQGDPGSSRFFLSLEDDLMRKFAGEWVSAVLTRLGMEEGEAIESKMVSPADRGGPEEGRGAQLRRPQEPARIRRGHGRAAEAGLLVPPAAARRHARQGRDPGDDRQPDPRGRRPVPRRRLRRGELRRVGRPAAGRRAQRRATSRASTLRGRRATRPGDRPRPRSATPIREAIEENLPSDAEPAEWTWQALANWANTRYGLNLKDKRPPQVRPVRPRRVRVRPRRARRVPRSRRRPRRSTQVDLDAGPRVPPGGLGPPLAGRLAAPQVRHRHRPRRLGRPGQGRGRPADPDRGPRSSTPARRPSCPSGSA